MEHMTSRERIAAALDGAEVDRVPFCPFLAYAWEHYPEAVQQRGQLAFLNEVGADPLWRGAPCPVKAIPPEVHTRTTESGRDVTTETLTPVGSLTSVHRRSEQGNTSFLIEHPLKSREDYKVLMWIEERTRFEYDASPLDAHFAGDGSEGFSIGMLLPRAKSAYQMLVEHYVGTEELVYAGVDFPETVEALLQVMVQRDLEAVRLAAESPYEYFISWEDSSTTNYSPSQYDAFIGSEIGEWCAILGAHGKRYVQHACGHVKELVGRMKRHGVYAIESISPPPTGNVSICEARSAVGGDFGIIGGIEPTAFLNMSMADLEAYAQQVIDEGSGGPFVLANSDSCPPGVSPEKFKCVAEVARRGTPIGSYR